MRGLDDVTKSRAVLGVMGPRARDVLGKVISRWTCPMRGVFVHQP